MKEKLFLFASTGQFSSFSELRQYIDPTYTEDGDAIPSAFKKEVGLKRFEPMCIEAITHPKPVSLKVLLQGASWADRWLPLVDNEKTYNAAICVFPPNEITSPEKCRMEYIGQFEY